MDPRWMDPRWTDPQWERIQRRPPDDDPSRWAMHAIGGRMHRIAQPVTFTPYAANRPCSARCRFCSENLRIDGERAAALLRPQGDYFVALAAALAELRGLPLSYSLSGLETTDDTAWCLRLLQTLQQAEREGVCVSERVLYSNGAGFARDGGDTLAAAFAAFGLSWVELSRHHHASARNDTIMRFRPGEPVAGDAGFAQAVERLRHAGLALRLVCIVQRDGIEDAAGVDAYLRWARSIGAGTVIFRELSRLDARYRDNATRRYIDGARTGIEGLVADCMQSPLGEAFVPQAATDGYYFRNLRLRHRDGLEVVFEASDYAHMHRHHDSGAVYKLVFHANGRLCAGWSPDRDVLWEHAA